MTGAQLSTIRQYPDRGYAGSLIGSGHDIDSAFNARDDVARVDTIVITAVDSTAYTVTANGVQISYTSDGSATVAEIRDGLAAAALASAAFNALATLVASGSDLVLTERHPENGPLTVAYGANLAATTDTDHQHETWHPAGVMVQLDDTQTVTEGPLPFKEANASGSQALGVIVYEPQYVDPSRTDSAVIPPQRVASIVKRGRIMVRVENAVTPADVPAYRVTASGANTQLGAFRTGTDSGNAVALTGLARFKEAAGAGELVELAINLP